MGSISLRSRTVAGIASIILAAPACQGPRGEPGDPGPPGPQGPQGPAGQSGTFAATPGSILIEMLDRAGAFTDLARGVPTTVTAGSKPGFGPTSEFADTNYWETSVINSQLNLDLGSVQTGIFAVLFESNPRGDATHIPAFSGTSAYTLQYSSDNFATEPVSVPAVAPVQGDIFIHRFTAPVSFRQLRFISNGPATIPNSVRISMLRVLAHDAGESTRIDSSRLYGRCRSGFFVVSDGHVCMDTGLHAAATMWAAIAACRTLAPGCRVCTHADFQQSCGSGFANPYGSVGTGWYGDHTTTSGGIGDNEYLTWNRGFCTDDNDGAPAVASASLQFHCCY